MTHTLDGTTKEALRRTIRELRERLLVDLHAATEGEYQLSVKPEKARLPEAQRVRRSRLDAWLDEQVRSVPAKEQKEARDRFRAQAEKEAAYTLLHRLVVIRQLEGHALLRPAVIAGCSKDWRNSQALRELTEHAPELCQDETEGFRFLLTLVFGEQHRWTPHAERAFGDLEARRIKWRKKREAGEVPMPIHGELEEDEPREHWKYYVPQPIPTEQDALLEEISERVRGEIKKDRRARLT